MPRAIQEGSRTDLLGGKRRLSFTTSATRGVWLAEQGQQSALVSVFDRYLVHAFGMREHKHIHFDHITEDLTARFAGQHLQDVDDEARRVCGVIARDQAALRDTEPVDRAPR